ncbi:Gamma-glutamylcyclotransferase family protein YtfP [Maioricimonas rarisocia]|uniref:Gamma-glutamylcyclotransferase family protein n=1 Tax=Maioricimonas rarisocia TaxID=2528026 RepID=A0A517Z6Z5_9PLAN|nr:gamma-glutamylcyclotransferase family protein [Maioricimonas rarisocia]QDU38266.1 Gamma-glutamylcyclotransferase family protein YtfP [Maioricimonas rarisocia]
MNVQPTSVFVYGTLMRGDCRHRVLAGQAFLGEARTVSRYRMFDIGSYPGLVESDDGLRIEGEVYRVDKDCLRMLDQVEGVDHGLYARRRIHLEAPFATQPVEGYLYLRSTQGLKDCGKRWHGASRSETWAGGPPPAPPATM